MRYLPALERPWPPGPRGLGPFAFPAIGRQRLSMVGALLLCAPEEREAHMPDWYRCPKCRTLKMLIGDAEKKCFVCDDTGGEIISGEYVGQGVKAGAYFNIDASGKPADGKRR